MRFAGLDIQINDYLMIDTYESMKEKFYCGYVHYHDANYIHLCGVRYNNEWLTHNIKVAVPIAHIIGIHKQTVADCDLGI